MTLDNQSAFVQVGQRVPRVTSVQTPTGGGTISNTTLENVGILLGVTPRISPDGLVVMEIDAERSQLSPGPGIPIGTSEGQTIESPIVDIATAQTTVSALSGQTVILGGLIETTSTVINRKVPFLGDLPIAGHLFRFDSVQEERNELMIIMTPHIVKDEADAEWIKQVESQRMSWCLADVVEVHGEGVLSGGGDVWSESWNDHPTDVIHPDRTPTVPEPALEPVPESVPVPEQPDRLVPPPPSADLGSHVPWTPPAMPQPVAAENARPLQSGWEASGGSQVRFREVSGASAQRDGFARPAAWPAPPTGLGAGAQSPVSGQTPPQQGRYEPPPAWPSSPTENRWNPVRDPSVQRAALDAGRMYPGSMYPGQTDGASRLPAVGTEYTPPETSRSSSYQRLGQ
jgi:hypothetical protein